MIYGGNLMSNFGGSMMSKDIDMTRDVILSEIHKILDKSPEVLIETLNQSGVATSKKISKRDLIHVVVENLYSNDKFKENIASVIIHGHEEKYHNANGELFNKLKGFMGGSSSATPTTGAAAPKISGGADPISAIAGAIGSIFSFAKSGTDKKAQAESDKRKLQMMALQDDTKKTNWMPIVLIGGVLLIGGIVAYVSLKQK